MRNVMKSFRWAVNGLKTVWREERNFRIEVVIACIVVSYGCLKDLSAYSWALLCVAITLVLTAEIVNTAVEDICNKIEPKQDSTIGKIKDIMAGFVLLASICATLLGMIIFEIGF